MCVAVPGKIISIENEIGKIDFMGVFRQISLELIEEVQVGDYVMIHAGYAIEKINEDEAKEILELVEEINSIE